MGEASKYKLYQTVQLARDVMKEGLMAGAVGTIVLVHELPYTAYEVEFTDEYGRTLAQVTLLEEELYCAPGNSLD